MAKTYNELKNYINSEITTKKEKGSITPFSHGAVLQEVVDFANENGGGSSTNYSLIITDSADNTQPASAINEVYLNLVNVTNNEVVSSTKLINGESIYVSYNTITGLKVNVVTINPTHIDPDSDFENGIKVIESVITNSTGQVTGTRKKILPNKKYVDDAIRSAIGDIGSALIFKGTLDNSITTETDTIKKNLPDNHKVGETWLVAKAGTYGGKTCEVGDMFVCTTTRTTANDSDWACIQANWAAIAGNENLQWNTSVTLATIGGVEVKAKLPQQPTIPTKTSQLENDSNFSNGVITGKHNVVDLRTSQGFDENTFYPVTIAMQDTTIKGSSNVRIRVMHNRTTLSASERPAWMTNSQGVTLCTEWEIGFGDYTKAGFSNRLIYNNQWWYAETNPCRNPEIFQKNNTETFYLRGGGKYDIYTNVDVIINFGASVVLDASNTLNSIQTDGTTANIKSKVTAFPQEAKRQSTAGLVRGANRVMMEFSEGKWDMLNNELKNAVIEEVATMPTTNHIQGRLVTSGATGRQKLYLNIGNGWDLIASEYWAGANFVRKTETGDIMYDISNYTTSNLITQITTNLGSSMLYHHILLTTNTTQIGDITIPLATIYSEIAGKAVLRLKNKKFIIDFPNAVAGDYSKETGIPFIVDFREASTHNDRYEPMEFNAHSNTNLVPELHFTLISNNTFVWVEDVRVYFKEK